MENDNPDLKSAAVTGHTSGIGLAIADALAAAGYAVRGYSLDNGYRIPDDIPRIVGEAQDCSIFVNCAYTGHFTNRDHDFSQVELLYELFERWQFHHKTIINISSTAGDYLIPYVWGPYSRARDLYSLHKNCLDAACLQLSNLSCKCKVVVIRPNFVDTPRVQYETQRKLRRTDVSNTVMWILNQPRDVHITSVTIKREPE